MTAPYRIDPHDVGPGTVAALVAAWIDPGPVPAYHRQMQDELRARWPVLARELDDLAAEATQSDRARRRRP